MILNPVVDFLIVLRGKGGISKQHLIDDDTYRPPIDQLSIASSLQHLRWNVVRRSHCAVGQFSASMRLGVIFLQVFFEGL